MVGIMIWTISGSLRELEAAGILPGSTILDAGAGQGIMQFLLAARGYQVISLDFSSRSVPIRSRGIFDIRGSGEASLDYKHPYMDFISYDGGGMRKWGSRLDLADLTKLLRLPRRFLRDITSLHCYLIERFFQQS